MNGRRPGGALVEEHVRPFGTPDRMYKRSRGNFISIQSYPAGMSNPERTVALVAPGGATRVVSESRRWKIVPVAGGR
jgi:hypothetical protein